MKFAVLLVAGCGRIAVGATTSSTIDRSNPVWTGSRLGVGTVGSDELLTLHWFALVP
jgi:hypothetical protein